MQSKELSASHIIDIPPGWGETEWEFKNKVLDLVRDAKFSAGYPVAPHFEIANTDGTVTPFFPILCAVSPEWGVITRKDIANVLHRRFMSRAQSAQMVATRNYADHILDTEYLAWGLQENIFLPDEIEDIRFDGDTPESYIRDYGIPDLMERAIDSIVHPYIPYRPIIQKVKIAVDDCCFCCESH